MTKGIHTLKRYWLSLLVLCCFPGFSIGQPSGVVRAGPEDISFSSESNMRISPAEIHIEMQLRTQTEDREDTLSTHTASQGQVFAVLDDMGATYVGQAESEFDIRENTSFVRRQTSATATSTISATIFTDAQLALVSELIDNTNGLSYIEHSLTYDEQDSLENIQKRVIDGLIQQATEYQTENDVTLQPIGLSKMDVHTEVIGEEVVDDLLNRNRLPQDTELSSDSIDLIGEMHQVMAELVFR